ncbi:hypothetical protein WJ96_05445 [Burkholderia ubonensis]|uniref:ArsR family transcriptional regulator n=1 Tax=Burkholderia ubonensis TaxID=101571 RepID=A0AAW3MWQ2_9BURK|nr:hypothetical protein [Burkholderia ubonensis]KVP75201.1 hypothetical protein WJ93_07235 [Burkholderia ubonensis]KVP96671.1 hypothetical protein WJ97_12370 [Burkholderia ubonensis]KVP98015.1 hypothetical protein WJ96_05445 [Burkholderia ubonensis]KVZ92712.1 hypothetical protein WL25_17105 [Burkholderia ubonensis]
MFLLAYESEDAVKQAAQSLRQLGARARKLLEECVEHQEVTRTKVSQAANQLFDAGFLFVTDVGDIWKSEYQLRPSLAGEEALEMLEQLESN